MKVVTKNIKKKLSSDLIELIWVFYNQAYQEIKTDDYQFFKLKN